MTPEERIEKYLRENLCRVCACEEECAQTNNKCLNFIEEEERELWERQCL